MNVLQDTEKKRGEHSVRLKTRVQNYFISAVCMMLSILILLLSITGVFSETDEDLQQILELQQQNTIARINAMTVDISASQLMLNVQTFHQCCSSIESQFGSIETLLLPIIGEEIRPSDGLATNAFPKIDTLQIKNGKKLNTYVSPQEEFVGLQTKFTVKDSELYLVTLLPKTPIVQIKMQNALIWTLAFSGMFIAFVLLSTYLSNQLTQPITHSLSVLQSEEAADNPTRSGIKEIDSLVSFMQSKPQQEADKLPADIADLFDTFAQRASTLTPTERSIVRYYINGKEINEVAELAFISIHTVRKHNANIYQKLGIGSRDELMLYIELFRRCDRLNELC